MAPDEPGVHLAIGDYYNWAFRDKAKAMEHWSVAEKGLPNNAELIFARAMVMFAEGQVEAAITELEKAVALSPKDAGGFVELAWVRMWAHDFPGSIAAADKAIELAPDENWPYLYRGISYFSWKGACLEAYAALDAADHDYPWYVWAMYNMEVADGKIDAAMARAATLPDGWSMLKTEVNPAALYEAFLRQYLGETDVARTKYKEAVAQLEKELPAHPKDARYHSALGLALAGAGQKERAVEMGLKATELLPYAKDIGYGINPIYDLAVIYTLVGDFDKAFEQLDFNLANPGNFTVECLEGDVRFDVLRKDPRYTALLKNYQIVS